MSFESFRPQAIRRALELGTLLAPFLVAPIRAQAPDLTVSYVDATAVSGNWQFLSISGSVTVNVANDGNAAAGAFAVQLFEDANGNGTWEPTVDRALGRGTVPGLGQGLRINAVVPVSGFVAFRGNLIYALVDSDSVVAESNEANNYGNSGRRCTYLPMPGQFRATLEWSWTSSMVMPNSLNVLTTPVVIDLNGDRVPDVVFATTDSTGGGSVEVGVLRALRGDTGAELFTVTDPALRLNVASTIAAGDIDGDGRPEIVACDANNSQLIAFEHDGTFKWRSAQLEAVSWGAIAIADLNGDNAPEIVIGRQVLRRDGTLLWTGSAGRGGISAGAVSLVADIDLDGKPDVVAGNTVYEANGAIKTGWPVPYGDGFNAVGNFDSDPYAEIVLVTGGTVRLLEHTGALKWGPVAIPGGGAGGPPTVADFDNDGQPEIGVAGAVRYAVFETDGVLRWAAVTQDGSSNVTGSSVFDFQGDGSAEVVYRDELKLRVYRGTDGTVLFETPMSSCTWYEYVLVADVDADGNAEIVAVANNNCGFGPQRGVYVYGATADDWVPTRQVWNQHTYHITNVNDDGTIPAIEPNNWQHPPAAPYNNYRQNVLTGLTPLAAPDLTASLLRFPCANQQPLVARIGNGGAVLVGPGIYVTFYDGDPRTTGTKIGTTRTTRRLDPGGYEDVALNLTTPLPTGPVFVVADDAGGLQGSENECDEANNLHSALPCTQAAAWASYGTGWPGTRGTPTLVLDAKPVLGTSVQLQLGSSAPSASYACILFGSAKASRATAFDGTILVDLALEIGVPITTGQNTYRMAVPCDVALCGGHYYMQAVQLDAGASKGVAFTAGLELVLGI